MANGTDPYKLYNEQIKTFETLAKRESELVQKLSQADADRDLDLKIEWTKELVAVLEARKKLHKNRLALLAQL
ncbi:MAG TPA: hypothetical protein VHK90_08470 [Thermoanaerobaculia bacterium]|nr:hypothetical protein [Thermoanaerobaculia bacterium]